MSIRSITTVSLALAAIVGLATPAMAFRDGGGRGDFGESLTVDLQRNPELIEPGAQQRRYLEYYGAAGWDQRWAAYYGYPAYRPNVQVRPSRRQPY